MRNRQRLALAAVCLVSAAIGALGQIEESFLNLPTPETVLATLRPEHPRLLATADDWEQIQARIESDELHAAWFEKVRAQAEAMLEQPPSTYEIPDGKRLLATSRRVLDRVLTLGFVYRINGDQRCRERLWRELEAAAAFKDWNPSHFLDTAEMTAAFGLAYDWLYHDWSPERRRTLREAILKHGLAPAELAYKPGQGSGWWTRTDNNWNQVCNGGLAIGALAIADEEPQRTSAILTAGLRSVRIAMRMFAPDGGCEEGPGYWGYATRYNVLYLAALESALGTDFGLSNYPGFEVTAEFPLYMNGPKGETFNYADASRKSRPAPQMYWFARRFARPDFAQAQDRLAVPTALDLLWRLPPDGPGQSPTLDRYFRGVEALSMRSAWNDRAALYVGFKAGDNAASHGHLDLGSFVFDALGGRWAMDLGGDNYNMPAYFGNQRWTYYRLRAEGHNTLLINPGEGPDQQPRATAKIVTFRSEPKEALAITDLSAAYQGSAEKVQRGIKLTDGRSRLLVQDEIQAEAGTTVWWFMHTQAQIALDEEAPSRAVLSLGTARLEARILSPAGATFAVMAARPLPTSPDPEMQHQNAGRRKLAIQLQTGEEALTTIVVLLTPYGAEGEPAPVPVDAVTPLADW